MLGARQVFERWLVEMGARRHGMAGTLRDGGELDRRVHCDRSRSDRKRGAASKRGKSEDRQRPDKARELLFQPGYLGKKFWDDEELVKKAQAVFSAFSKMETRLFERARVIYKVWYKRL